MNEISREQRRRKPKVWIGVAKFPMTDQIHDVEIHEPLDADKKQMETRFHS